MENVSHVNSPRRDPMQNHATAMPDPVAPPVYSQTKCPTMRQYVKDGDSIVGQEGVEDIRAGRKPKPDKIRVRSVSMPNLCRRGVGLHEMVPTSMSGEIARWADAARRDAISQLQSGLRTSTCTTLFVVPDPHSPNGERMVAAHTGALLASVNSSRAVAGTSGQKAAHDRMREEVRLLENSILSPERMGLAIVHRHIAISANGWDILNDHRLTGLIPVIRGIGKLEPPPVKGDDPSITTPNRFKFAQMVHGQTHPEPRGREGLKHLQRSATDEVQRREPNSPRPPSPSPERTPLTSDPGSGKHRTDGMKSPPPKKFAFPSKNTLAHWAAQMTAPGRINPEVPMKPSGLSKSSRN